MCKDSFDIVMFPVDGRIGNGYTRGARQFVDQFMWACLFPCTLWRVASRVHGE